jgi:hypothetical protein
VSPNDRHSAARRATRHFVATIASLVVALGLAALAAAPVVAHAELATSEPADKAVLATSPTTVTLTFTESLDGSKSSFKLLGPDGAAIGTGQKSADKAMTLDGLTLGPGAYEIQWTSASAEDGDIARGTLTFTVMAATNSPSAAASPTASPTAGPASPSAAPSPTPAASPVATPAASSGGSDVILPIAVALVALALGAIYLLRRSRRAA